MAKKVKITQKELKQPDRFRQITADATLWVQHNYKLLTTALFGVLLIIALSFLFLHLEQQKAQRANLEFREIISGYAQNGSAESSREVLARLADFRERYSDVKIAHLSLYYSGSISFDRGEYEESIEFLKGFLSSEVPDEMLRNSALLKVGLAYYNLEKWNKAIECLSSVDAENTAFGIQARLHIGLAYEKLGKHEKARTIYEDTLGLL